MHIHLILLLQLGAPISIYKHQGMIYFCCMYVPRPCYFVVHGNKLYLDSQYSQIVQHNFSNYKYNFYTVHWLNFCCSSLFVTLFIYNHELKIHRSSYLLLFLRLRIVFDLLNQRINDLMNTYSLTQREIMLTLMELINWNILL